MRGGPLAQPAPHRFLGFTWNIASPDPWFHVKRREVYRDAPHGAPTSARRLGTDTGQ